MTASFDRRRALTGAAAFTVGVPVLAACGDSGSDAGDDATATDQPSGAAGDSLASVGDVPVGGCFVVGSAKVVVTQPTEGEFRAFSSTCTHQGCQVSSGTDGVIPCNCHGSQFSLEDGSVEQGPATSALAEVDIVVEGDSIVRA